MRKKHIFILLVCICILSILNCMYFKMFLSLMILIINITFNAIFVIVFHRVCGSFRENESYRVFHPHIQVIVSLVTLIFNAVYHSNFTCIIANAQFTKYDYIKYGIVIIIGYSLFFATKMRKIVFVQLFHVVVIPICIFVFYVFPERFILNSAVAVIGAYSIFQCIMTDKKIVAKLKRNMTKYRLPQ